MDSYTCPRYRADLAPDSTDGAELPDQFGGAVTGFVLEILGAGLPGAGLVAQLFFRKVREEWTRHRSTALRAAVRASGLTLEDLRERITEVFSAALTS